jgi:hypothetical protein
MRGRSCIHNYKEMETSLRRQKETNNAPTMVLESWSNSQNSEAEQEGVVIVTYYLSIPAAAVDTYLKGESAFRRIPSLRPSTVKQ